MFPLAIILGIIMIWCFYFRFMKAVMARRRLIFVEVMDQSNSEFYISRFQAKQNLHLVGEVTQKLRSYNYLFDKYWYMQREYTYIEDINHVEQNQFNNKLIEIAAGNPEKEEANPQTEVKDAQSITNQPENAIENPKSTPATPESGTQKIHQKKTNDDDSKDGPADEKVNPQQ